MSRNDNNFSNSEYKKNYFKLYFASSFDNIANELSSSALIVAYALFLGLNERAVSLFLSLRIFFCIIQVFSAPLFSRISQSKKTVLSIYYASRVFFFCLIFLGLIPSIKLKTIIFFILISLNAIFAQITYALFVNWRMQLLKKDDAKRFKMQKDTLVISLSTAILFIMSWLLDKSLEYWIFILIFSIIQLITTTDVILRVKTSKPEVVEKKNISLKKTFIIPLQNKNFRKIIWLNTIYNLAFNMSTCFLSLYLIKYLHLNFTYITILTIIMCLSSIIGSWCFGKIALKFDNYNFSIWFSILCLIIFSSLFASFGSYMYYIAPIAYFIFGFGKSGFELFQNNAIYEHADKNNKTMFVSICKFFTGVSSIIITVVSIFAISKVNNMSIFRILFAVSAIIAALAFVFYFVFLSKPNRKKEQKEESEIVDTIDSNEPR